MQRILTFACFLIYHMNLFAAVCTWTNYSGDHKWSNPANWLPSGVPGIADEVIFNEYSKEYCLIDKPVHVKGIQLQANFSSTLEQLGGISIFIGEAGLSIDGGTFQLTDNKLLIRGPYYQSNGTFQSGKSQITFSHKFHISGGSFSLFQKPWPKQVDLKPDRS